MEDDLKKIKMEDDLNFKAVLLRLFNNKTSKANGFDTIEIDLVMWLVKYKHVYNISTGGGANLPYISGLCMRTSILRNTDGNWS